MSEQDVGQVMAPPGAEHERLKAFAGTFRAEVKLWMGPGEPLTMTGTMVNSMDLGGRFLRQEYTGDPAPGPFPAFEGRGFWGYNDVVGRFEGLWIDNASTVMQTDTGSVDDAGKTWTMSGKVPDPQSGELITKRSVITLEDDDHHRIEMFFVKGGQEFKTMEIAYVRNG